MLVSEIVGQPISEGLRKSIASLDEDWRKWAAPAALAAASMGGYAARASGHGGDPSWLQDPPAQVQQQAPSKPSVTVDLPPAEVRGADVSDAVYHRPDQTAMQKEQATLLALTMWGEARNQGVQGMRAVGHVIINRMKSDRRFGGDVKHIVWKRKAFSCWNPSDPNREAMKEISDLPHDSEDYKRWKQAKKLATELLSGKLRDITGGALFYHTQDTKPTWAQGIKPVAQLADHLFYRDDHKIRTAKADTRSSTRSA